MIETPQIRARKIEENFNKWDEVPLESLSMMEKP
jgi:hypothetical protein